MKTRKLLIFISILLMLVVSACAGANAGNDGEDGEALPPVAAVKAREALAARLGIDLSAVEIVSQEQAEWSDSCLGLGGPAESCLQALVSGWRVELEAEGETYIARTDELGETIRFEGLEQPPVGGPEDLTPEAALKARESLAAELGFEIEEIMISEITQAEWSDSCLGLGGPAESCLQALVPGWRVVLIAGSESYVARTDATGDVIRFEGFQTPPLGDAELPPVAALEAQKALAARLNIDVEAVTIVAFEPAEWPDGCLGLAEAGEMCTMALVSGWRVELIAEGETYIARTNENGTHVRFEQ